MIERILTFILVYVVASSGVNGGISSNMVKEVATNIYCDKLYSDYLEEKEALIEGQRESLNNSQETESVEEVNNVTGLTDEETEEMYEGTEEMYEGTDEYVYDTETVSDINDAYTYETEAIQQEQVHSTECVEEVYNTEYIE